MGNCNNVCLDIANWVLSLLIMAVLFYEVKTLVLFYQENISMKEIGLHIITGKNKLLSWYFRKTENNILLLTSIILTSIYTELLVFKITVP